MKDYIKRCMLYLKYLSINKFEGKDVFKNLCEHYNECKNMRCEYRAEYLYHFFIEQGFNPKLIKIYLKNNNEIAPFRKQFHHISGENFGFHYVVQLDNRIFDSNLFLCKPIKKQDYFNRVITYDDKNELIEEEVASQYSFDQVRNHLKNSCYRLVSKWN